MTREDAKMFMRKEWRECMKGSFAESAFEMAIDALEQPEIIFCKDCKYGGMKENEEGYCAASAIEQEITGTDYCSWAERRET